MVKDGEAGIFWIAWEDVQAFFEGIHSSWSPVRLLVARVGFGVWGVGCGERGGGQEGGGREEAWVCGGCGDCRGYVSGG